MMDARSAPESALQPDALKTRETLARRLADIVCLPTSRITPQERHIAADLLVDMLNEATSDFRLRCAQRIAGLPEAPSSVLRRLATDESSISEAVILESKALTDADLAAIARTGDPAV